MSTYTKFWGTFCPKPMLKPYRLNSVNLGTLGASRWKYFLSGHSYGQLTSCILNSAFSLVHLPSSISLLLKIAYRRSHIVNRRCSSPESDMRYMIDDLRFTIYSQLFFSCRLDNCPEGAISTGRSPS